MKSNWLLCWQKNRHMENVADCFDSFTSQSWQHCLFLTNITLNMQTDVFTVAFKLLYQKNKIKRPIDKQLPDSYHITVLFFTIHFSFLERNSYATGGWAGPPSGGTGKRVQLWETATCVANALLWILGSAGSRWTEPWGGWLCSLSCCCQHAWPSRSTSRASLTSCWRTRARPTWLRRMIPSFPALGPCAPSAASAISAWCSAPT